MNKLSILLFILISFGLKAQPVINVSAINADPGEVACIDFTVENFVDIVSVQYTMQWDPAVLSFNSINNYGLPGLNPANFGQTLIGNGQLTLSWLELTISPVNLNDGDEYIPFVLM